MLRMQWCAPLAAALVLSACGGGGGGNSGGGSSGGSCTGNCALLPAAGSPSGVAGAAPLVIGQDSATDTSSGTAPTASSPVKFSSPASVSISDTGAYLVVADTANNRVLIWNGLPTSNVAPSVVIGQPGLNSAVANYPGGSPGAASLDAPSAAVIAGGKLFVADSGNDRVLIWNAVPGSNDAPASVVLGQATFTTNNPGIDSYNSGAGSYVLAMSQPTDVWSNGQQLLVVDGSNNRVLAWSGIPTSNNQLPAGIIGQRAFGQNLSAVGASGFAAPSGVASDGVNVFVADTNNNRVLEFQKYLSSPTMGPAADHVFGQIDFNRNAYNDPSQNGISGATPTSGTFHSPSGVRISGGQLYVTDSENNRVLGFSSTGGIAPAQD